MSILRSNNVQNSFNAVSFRLCLLTLLLLVCVSSVCSTSFVSSMVDYDFSPEELDDSTEIEEIDYGPVYSNYIELVPISQARKPKLFNVLLRSAYVQPDNVRNVRPIVSNKRYTGQTFHAMRGWKSNKFNFASFSILNVVFVCWTQKFFSSRRKSIFRFELMIFFPFVEQQKKRFRFQGNTHHRHSINKISHWKSSVEGAPSVMIEFRLLTTQSNQIERKKHRTQWPRSNHLKRTRIKRRSRD